MGSKQLQVTKWHLTKMHRDHNMASKTITKETGR